MRRRTTLAIWVLVLLPRSSVFVLGLFLIASAYFTQRAFNFSLFTAVLVIAGVGAMGVGVFPETVATVHFLA